MFVNVKVLKLKNFKGELPNYETPGASGMDVRAQLEDSILVEPGKRALIPTGLMLQIPQGYEIQVRPRSGWAIREGLTVINSPGTIDSDYRGEIQIGVINLGERPLSIKNQDRIAQLVLCPVIQLVWEPTDQLSPTERSSGGFGSTGK